MALSHAILTALIEDELSGYDLAKAFETSLGIFWQASHQQIYQELRKLTVKDLLSKRQVEQNGRPNKILYGITARGRDALDSWVFQAAKTQPRKDELMLKFYSLNQSNLAHLALEVERRREQVMQRLYLYEKLRRGDYADPEELPLRRKGVYLALMAGMSEGQYFLQWCDMALNMLRSVEEGGG